MKLRNFQATDVYGFLNFNIHFSDTLNFLVGVNGSGKTTALRLIQAMLTPSLRDLLVIPFTQTTVGYSDGGKETKLTASKVADKLELTVTGQSESLIVPAIDAEELDYIMSRTKRSEEIFEDFQIRFSEHPVFQFISSISAPVILGLDRTHKPLLDMPSDYHFERELVLTKGRQGAIRGRRVLRGTLAAGLMESELLIQEAYRKLRELEDEHSRQLRESIFLSAFKFISFTPTEFFPALLNKSPWLHRQDILKRRTEIEGALPKIGILSKEITDTLREFFDRLEALFKKV